MLIGVNIDMSVKVILAEYRKELNKQEKTKPVELRKNVPTTEELAEYLGMSRPGYMKFAKDHTRNIDKVKVDLAIKLFRKRGFDTQLTDVLELTYED